MQTRSRRCTILIALVLGLGWAVAAGAAGVVTNTLTFTEALTEKVVCLTDTELYCGLVPADNFTVTAKLLVPDVDFTTIGPATTFEFSLGGLQISRQLSSDAKYRAGKTSATLTSSYIDAKNKTVVFLTTSLKWSTKPVKQVTVAIKGKTTNTGVPGWMSIRTAAYAGQETRTVNEALVASAKFGTASFTFPAVNVTGTVVTKQVTARDHTTLAPTTVKLKGSGYGAGAAPQPPVNPAEVVLGSNVEVTNVVINTQGGSVTISNGILSGVKVIIPAGALPTNQQIIVSQNNSTVVPKSGTFSGKTLNIDTDGTHHFDEPIEITIPFVPNSGTIPVPYYIDTNGHLRACQVTGIDRQAGTLTFEAWHASPFTWILANFGATEAHTTYQPAHDGFQVNNATYSTPYNKGGNCFGMCAFEQWYFTKKGGGFYPKYMQDLPVPGYAPIKGQDCIAVRAHNSVNRVYEHYWERKASQFSLTAEERYAYIVNVIANTAAPTILSGRAEPAGHAFLAYESTKSGTTNTLWLNDPNRPGLPIAMTYIDGSTNLQYNTTYGYVFTNITVMGDGSWQFEPFDLIYDDAERNFSGSGAAQVNVTSHTNMQTVLDRTITLSGIVSNGQVAVNRLHIINNGTRYAGDVSLAGNFQIPVSIVAGTNQMTFETYGWMASAKANLLVLNTQIAPFNLMYMQTSAVILVTMTWNTGDTDLDLYTVDPQGDYSAYYHMTTADGGELDHDDTNGYGPEHWTLSGTDTVRWDQGYKVRIHYYSDHQARPNDDPPVPVRPSSWKVTVVVYEGEERMETYTFSGVLSAANSSNTGATASGGDWADVCTITPTQPAQQRVHPARGVTVEKLEIKAPTPTEEERQRIKQENQTQSR